MSKIAMISFARWACRQDAKRVMTVYTWQSRSFSILTGIVDRAFSQYRHFPGYLQACSHLDKVIGGDQFIWCSPVTETTIGSTMAECEFEWEVDVRDCDKILDHDLWFDLIKKSAVSELPSGLFIHSFNNNHEQIIVKLPLKGKVKRVWAVDLPYRFAARASNTFSDVDPDTLKIIPTIHPVNPRQRRPRMVSLLGPSKEIADGANGE
jgi:hypothetical protein